jgi:hypothetical protein
MSDDWNSSGSGQHFCQYPLILSPKHAQYSCPHYAHHRKPIIGGEFQKDFNFLGSKTQQQFAVWCTSTRLATGDPFLTGNNTKHYVHQAVPHGKLKPMEQWKISYKYCFKVTKIARDTCAEALLSERPLYIQTLADWSCSKLRTFRLLKNKWLE